MNTIRTSPVFPLVTGVLGFVVGVACLLYINANAGNLEPNDPPGPTMKTLDEVEPRIPIPGSATPTARLDITEPGSYYLTGDRVASTNGIRIRSSDVTLDLMGYALSGPGKEAGSYTGIEIGYASDAHENIEVTNGTVRGFGSTNIRSQVATSQVRIISVRIESGGGGIVLYSHGSLIKDCAAKGNGSGFYASGNGTITGCTSCENDGTGIQVDARCRAVGNTANNNGTVGIRASWASEVADNNVSENGEAGIHGTYGNLITGNTCTLNGLDGIIAVDGCTLKDNLCYGNGDDGIETRDGCTIENNTVKDNADYGIYAGSGCTVIGNTGYGHANDYGIRAFHGSVLKDNAAYNNHRGIYAGEACTVFGNVAYNNATWGIYVYRQSLVARNTAYSNVTGGGGEVNLRTDATCTVLTNHAP